MSDILRVRHQASTLLAAQPVPAFRGGKFSLAAMLVLAMGLGLATAPSLAQQNLDQLDPGARPSQQDHRRHPDKEDFTTDPDNSADNGSAPDDAANAARQGDSKAIAAKRAETSKARKRKRRKLRALLWRRPGQSIPENPDERDKLLAELYKRLASATSEAQANQIVKVIEHVWSFSGSDTVTLLMQRGLLAAKLKQYRKAARFFTEIVRIAPGYVEGWNQRAYVYFKQKKLHLALGDLRRVLAMDPNHFKALEGFGQTLIEIDKKREALKVFRQLRKIHPMSKAAKHTVQQLEAQIHGQPI